MSVTTRPDCIYDMEVVATFFRWPHSNKYVYSLRTNSNKLENSNVDTRY